MGGKRKKKPDSYRERNYRRELDTGDLASFEVKVRETDLQIFATRDVQKEAEHQVIGLRNQLENYIAANHSFLGSLVPLPADPLAPPIVREMLAAGKAAGVGPMAAVAGVISERVGIHLLGLDTIDEVMVENGGDIFLRRTKDTTVAIFAGESPLSGRIGLKIAAAEMPLGICTSSGTVGHSLSFGRADSVTVLSGSTALADAVATRLGNAVGSSADISRALEIAAAIPGIIGVVIVMGEELGAWGKVELVRI
ncbi:MAG: UPF0280 family protein [Proteobacteria bacterium]|nr:UPF0280 family protein [Pseudomonadota bacterium]MBU1739499.1 UPF0280 family protein [Pseudomonadota bacterium]